MHARTHWTGRQKQFRSRYLTEEEMSVNRRIWRPRQRDKILSSLLSPFNHISLSLRCILASLLVLLVSSIPPSDVSSLSAVLVEGRKPREADNGHITPLPPPVRAFLIPPPLNSFLPFSAVPFHFSSSPLAGRALLTLALPRFCCAACQRMTNEHYAASRFS